MSEILNKKQQQVILGLIENLSSKNQHDLEACLNAHFILTELTEYDTTFAKLINKECIVKLMVAASDLYNN